VQVKCAAIDTYGMYEAQIHCINVNNEDQFLAITVRRFVDSDTIRVHELVCQCLAILTQSFLLE
jgi:hypothetical protein